MRGTTQAGEACEVTTDLTAREEKDPLASGLQVTAGN